MSKKHSVSQISQSSMMPAVLASVALAIAGLVYFAGNYKILTVLAGLCGVYLLLRRDLTPLRSVPAVLLLIYVVFSGLTRLWAISGKFFLMEFSEIFVAAVLFLAVMLAKKFDRHTVRSVMVVIVGMSTIFSVLSVEAATTGVCKTILSALIPSFASVSTGFEAGTRLTGIIGNANILSSIVAVGIFFSICLLCGEENQKKRLNYAAATAVNAFVFLLLFSMGGSACFVVAILCYLIFAGENRGSALVRMLECALPALIWVFVAFPFFNREGAVAVIPLIAMVGNVITVAALEKLMAPRLIQVLRNRNKLVLGVLAGVLVLAGAYIALGVTLSGAYTFGGEALERGAYPVAGQHTLSIQASGDVNVTIISQDMSEVMMHTNTVLYKGNADGAVFSVPEDSEVCYFTFTAPEGTVLEEAKLDSGESLKLKYTILPGFIANRLQGLSANQNAIQRTVFFRDGMKMFYQSPIVGNGIGSFETGITSVQEFFYETKYIHNHYIQILLEAGILGFVPFVGSLLGMVWLLLKRRKDDGWEFKVEYPALWATLVMTICHMIVEVSMSIILFICIAFMTFALIIRCCQQLPEATPAPKGAERAKQQRKVLTAKLACAVLPAVFVLSLCSNMAANSIASGGANTNEAFLQNLALSAKLDPYEGNDAKLSYVMNVYYAQMDEYFPQANEYAEELLQVQSNSIPLALLEYYLGTGQYEQAFEAARAGAAYSASDAQVWNSAAAIFSSSLLNKSGSLLLGDEGQMLLDGVLDYYGLLGQRNADSMEDIALDLNAKDFFSKILALSETDRSAEEILPVLSLHIFDSATCCDANRDNIPDQVAKYSGVAFAEDRAMEFAADSTLALEMDSQNLGAMARVSITCQDPTALTVKDGTGATVQGQFADGTWTGEIPQFQGNPPAMGLTITSSSAQRVESITVTSAE